MAFSISDGDAPFISVTMSACLDDDELPHYQDAIYSCPGYGTKNQLVDYTLVTEYLITAQALLDFVTRALLRPEVQKADKRRKIAMVSPAALSFGMTRVFLAHAEKMPANYNVFRTRVEALAWLESDSAETI